ncbi:MAG: MFS transporter [Coriobacteriia bacterium]|nr:MFS transporter [Coriobacteriia bacterium]
MTASRNEQWLYLANFVREIGIQAAYWLGILGYAAYGFGGDARIVMTVMLAVNLSQMIASIIGGAIVDRIGPRLTILWSSVLVAVIGVLSVFVREDVVTFVIFAACFSVAITILNTAYTSFAPYLERGKAGLRRVNSFLTVGTFIAAVVGPAVGAIATANWPITSVFFLMTIVTILGALVVLRVHEKYSPNGDDDKTCEKTAEECVPAMTDDPVLAAEIAVREAGLKLDDPIRPIETSITAGTALAGRTVPKRRVKDPNPFSEAMEGWHIIRASKNLRYYLMVFIAMIFGFGAFDALEPIFFKQVLEVQISTLGWVNAAGGVGLMIGVILLALFPLKWVNSRLLIALLLACGVGAVVYVGTVNLWWVVSGQLILGFAFGVFDPLMRTMVQADSPLEAVGRVLGTINMIGLGILLVPLVLAPWLSDLFGVQEVLIFMGALPLVFGALLYPSGRKLDKEAAAAGGRKIESLSIIED